MVGLIEELKSSPEGFKREARGKESKGKISQLFWKFRELRAKIFQSILERSPATLRYPRQCD